MSLDYEGLFTTYVLYVSARVSIGVIQSSTNSTVLIFVLNAPEPPYFNDTSYTRTALDNITVDTAVGPPVKGTVWGFVCKGVF